MSGLYVASSTTARWFMQAHFERRLHTDEVAELRIVCAVARVLVQLFCSQCSRPHCIEQLDLLETLLAAD